MKNDVKAALPELGYAQLVCSIEMIKRMTHFGITLFFRSSSLKQSGAAEACWAHNPEVRRSKLRSARQMFDYQLPFFFNFFVRN